MSKGKKITVFSIIGVVLALVLVVIILACVPSHFNNFVVNNCNEIMIYYNGKNIGKNEEEIVFVNNPEGFSEKNYETYLKLNDEVKKASSEKVLTALFQGSYKFESELDEKEFDLKKMLNTADSTYLIFDYKNNEQSVIIQGTEIKFYSLIMEVKNVDYLTETSIYFQKNNTTSLSEMKSDYATTFLAKQADLYNMIEGLFN